MDYKSKYLKYKLKYLNLKGGKSCDKCPKKGFIQHDGECWHDAFSMIILFSNDLSDEIQELFNSWLDNELLIDIHFEKIFSDRTRDELLPCNIEILTDELKDKIKSYIKQLFTRYKKEFLYHAEIKDEIRVFLRQLSSDTSLMCIDNAFTILNTNMKKVANKYQREYDKSHGGKIMDIFLLKSLINYVFSKKQIIQMIEIDLELVIKNKFVTLDTICKLINKCNAIIINLTFNKNDSTGHAISCFKCKDNEYVYDNNRGVYYGDEISIKKFQWKKALLNYFTSYENLENINDFLSAFAGYYDELPDKHIYTITFLYSDDIGSNDYYYSPVLHYIYENKRSIKLWNDKFISIAKNQNPYKCLDDELLDISLFKQPQLIHLLLDNNIEIDINNYEIVQNAIFSNDIDLFKKIVNYKNFDINNKKNLPIIYALSVKNQEIINLIINNPKFDISILHDEIGSILNFSLIDVSLNNVSKILIEKGIDISTINKHNKTPLDYSIEYNNKEIFDILLDLYKKRNIVIRINDITWEDFDDYNEELENKEQIKKYYIDALN